MCFSINAPITFSWISTEREKQIVLRPNRLMRVRSADESPNDFYQNH
ncbi:hypothetical protein ECDEC12D_1285 [Escherichia coli DEC12D]|nr:hypothetical protein ECDEC12D_1285 [Escherichia coli DEC12D]